MSRAACLALVLATGCVQFQLDRDRRFEPVQVEKADLEIGDADLGRCLARLGAPHLVTAAGDGGMWLVYAWSDNVDWQIVVTFPVWRFITGSFTWDSSATDLNGVALRFDGELTLREMRRGRLSAIFTGGKDGNRRKRARAEPGE